MPTVAPSAAFQTVAQFATGLTGTVGVRIDQEGSNIQARQTTGITEYPAGSGIYIASLTSPSTAGTYQVVWDDTSTFVVDTLTVTFGDPAALTGTNYVTRDELKTALSLTNQTYADADIDIACWSASRAIDDACGRFFYPSVETRYYDADPCDPELIIDDLSVLTSLKTDVGPGTFNTTLTEGTHFRLNPYNAPLIGYPWESVKLIKLSGWVWPYHGEYNVQISGTFGWTAVPPEVRQFAKIFAAKLLLRSRQAPFGVLSYGMDQPIAVRIARHDPDFEKMLGHLVRSRLFL